jgi:chorismate mutase
MVLSLWPKLPCLILQTSNADPFSLMDMLIFKAVEEQVKKRVANKARIFEQNATDSECKVDPKVLSKLYDQWVMPQTKDVEVEYLLRCLD